jgi:hypothetical protein
MAIAYFGRSVLKSLAIQVHGGVKKRIHVLCLRMHVSKTLLLTYLVMFSSFCVLMVHTRCARCGLLRGDADDYTDTDAGSDAVTYTDTNTDSNTDNRNA